MRGVNCHLHFLNLTNTDDTTAFMGGQGLYGTLESHHKVQLHVGQYLVKGREVGM
jgi:hypothetical protein